MTITKEPRMSIFTRPRVAAAAARLIQGATVAGGTAAAKKAGARLPEFAARTETIEIPTSVGPATVTVYRREPSEGAPPVHVNLHGGGYVIGLTSTDDPACRILANLSGSVVLNIDYVVAPQHPFPEPPQQVYEVVEWVAAHGDEHGWDGSRLTIGGQSAGGGLAAAAARLSWEKKGPKIALQVLHYPPLDLSVSAGTKGSPIAKPALRPWMGDLFDTAYAPDPATRTDRLMSPAGAADSVMLTGIAPALVISAGNDILRDEARRYADRLDAVGALVEYREIAGVDHGYDMGDDVRARESYTLIAERIAAAVAR
jgi:acetyl esterase